MRIIAFDIFSKKEKDHIFNLFGEIEYFNDLESFLRADANLVIVLASDENANFFYFHFYKREIDVFFVGKTDNDILIALEKVADIEKDRKESLISVGREEKLLKGGRVGGPPPYGYDAIGKKLVKNTKESETVVYIYSLRSTHTLKEIADALNSCGIKTKRGKTFTVSTIQAILRNENIYKGLVNINGTWQKGIHDPII